MKRILLILALACLSLTARAQVRSLGANLGFYQAVSFQHWVYGTDNVFQLDLGYMAGLPQSGSVRMMASYNMMILSPDWSKEGKWNFYAGPGAYIGSGWTTGKGLDFGIMAIVGLEYLFDFPLMLSVDMRPMVGTVLSGEDFVFDRDCLLGLAPTVSARYLF